MVDADKVGRARPASELEIHHALDHSWKWQRHPDRYFLVPPHDRGYVDLGHASGRQVDGPMELLAALHVIVDRRRAAVVRHEEGKRFPEAGGGEALGEIEIRFHGP